MKSSKNSNFWIDFAKTLTYNMLASRNMARGETDAQYRTGRAGDSAKLR
jgi:hypothetical protein